MESHVVPGVDPTQLKPAENTYLRSLLRKAVKENTPESKILLLSKAVKENTPESKKKDFDYKLIYRVCASDKTKHHFDVYDGEILGGIEPARHQNFPSNTA